MSFCRPFNQPNPAVNCFHNYRSSCGFCRQTAGNNWQLLNTVSRSFLTHVFPNTQKYRLSKTLSNQSRSQRHHSRLNPVVHRQFIHNVADVSFDRVGTQVKSGRNFRIAVAFYHQFQHF